MNKKQITKIVVGIVLLFVVVAGLLLAYTKFKPKATSESKTVTIEVVDDKGETTFYTVESNASTLKEVMDIADGLTYSGDESEYGLMITTVNGVIAEYSQNNAYWAFYVNGEYCNYGIEEQPINDEDTFKIEYTSAQ